MVKNGIVSQATISKWGNSQGIRLPKNILEKLHLRENDKVEISVKGEEIIIQKTKKYNNLEERLEAFYGRPISEIGKIEDEKEVDWGAPEGDEIW